VIGEVPQALDPTNRTDVLRMIDRGKVCYVFLNNSQDKQHVLMTVSKVPVWALYLRLPLKWPCI